MPKKLTTYIVFFAFLHFVGCYSFDAVSLSELDSRNKNDSTSVDVYFTMSDDTKYHCSRESIVIGEDSIFINGLKVITGNKEEHFEGSIAIRDIKSIDYRDFDYVRTFLLAGSLVGLIVMIIVLSTSSKSTKKETNYNGCSSSYGGYNSGCSRYGRF